MKHLFSILYFTALCGTAFSQPTGYSGNIHITPKVLQQKGTPCIAKSCLMYAE
jgi:hypothetical protein